MPQLKLVLKTRPVWLLLVAVSIALVVGLLIPTSAPFRGPLVDINDGLMLGILAGLGLFVGHLYSRIGKIEGDLRTFIAENDGLRSDLRAAATFIDRLGLWVAAGMPADKMPRPPKQLADHIDAELWAEDAVGGTDD